MGVAAEALSAEQRRLLEGVIKAYVHTVAPVIADSAWQEMEEAGIRKISFAWAGSDRPGSNHYYRIQGPTFIIEYDSRDGGSHIHCVWRSFDGDFGQDVLAQHLALAH